MFQTGDVAISKLMVVAFYDSSFSDFEFISRRSIFLVLKSEIRPLSLSDTQAQKFEVLTVIVDEMIYYVRFSFNDNESEKFLEKISSL